MWYYLNVLFCEGICIEDFHHRPFHTTTSIAMELIVCCIATLDSKAEEVKFLAHHLSSALQSFLPPSLQFKLKIVDVSTSHNKHSSSSIADFSVQNILSCHPDSSKHSPSSLPSDRASAISIVSLALQHFLQNLQSNGQLAGAIGLGGSGGTALIAPALRALPLGLPKIIVSTVACGNTAHYIGSSDLLLLPAVVDICGLNSISKVILSNAAGAAAGMIALKAAMTSNGGLFDSPKRPTLGMTMFGLTTPCVEAVRRKLEEKGFEALIFHATGTGGQTMESLVNQGLIQGVLDITTTEIADYIVGGVMACSENRLDAIIEKKIPLVLSVGALDMVNFGSRDSVPGKFSHRKLHIHNNQVTVMRTTVDENKEFARFIAKKLNNASHPVCILLPEKGVSGLDALGKPFYDPEATGALLDCLEKEIIQSTNCQVKRVPYHINDPQFADAVLEAFLDIMPSSPNIGAEDDNQVKVQSRLPIEPELKSLAKTPDKFLNAKEDTMTMRELVLQRLRQEIGRGVPIIGAGAGTGISAKFEEVGGADLIVVYNSGRFRMAGRGSLAGLLPFSDANSVVVQLASEVFPVVKKVPVLAGVCGTDPFRCIDRFLHELKGLGFVGVQNFPTVGLIDGKFRQNLEETGMGYGLEVEMIRKAHEMGLLTTPYAFNEEESTAMAEAGADIIVAHMGLTSSGSIGAKSVLSLEDSVHVVQQIADAAHKVNPDIIVLSHGGPITGPDECAFILQHTTGVHGFYGASSIERLPVEKAITTIMQQYKSISLS